MTTGHIDSQGRLLVTRDNGSPIVSTTDCPACCGPGEPEQCETDNPEWPHIIAPNPDRTIVNASWDARMIRPGEFEQTIFTGAITDDEYTFVRDGCLALDPINIGTGVTESGNGIIHILTIDFLLSRRSLPGVSIDGGPHDSRNHPCAPIIGAVNYYEAQNPIFTHAITTNQGGDVDYVLQRPSFTGGAIVYPNNSLAVDYPTFADPTTEPPLSDEDETFCQPVIQSLMRFEGRRKSETWNDATDGFNDADGDVDITFTQTHSVTGTLDDFTYRVVTEYTAVGTLQVSGFTRQVDTLLSSDISIRHLGLLKQNSAFVPPDFS